MELKDIIVVIPAYEPDENLLKVMEQLTLIPFLGILIIDDGSGEVYKTIFKQCLNYKNCIVLTHGINCGKGSALKTGFEYIIKKIPNCSGVITADSDGQHTPSDIKKIADELCINTESLIIGSRNCLNKKVPFKSRIGNVLTRNIFLFLSGCKVRDTQSGLRGFSRKNMQEFIKFKGERFDYEMYMLMECRSLRLKIHEIPIETVYIEGNRTSHFNPFLDSIRIYFIFLKFIFSSLAAALIDFIIFCIIINLQFSLLAAMVSARVVSSVTNFAINKAVVFNNKESYLKSIFKYYSLVVIIGVLSYLLITLLSSVWGMNVLIAKIIAETILFLLSYYLQRIFVF